MMFKIHRFQGCALKQCRFCDVLAYAHICCKSVWRNILLLIIYPMGCGDADDSVSKSNVKGMPDSSVRIHEMGDVYGSSEVHTPALSKIFFEPYATAVVRKSRVSLAQEDAMNFDSTTATRSPLCARRNAATVPTSPAPKMTQSNVSMVLSIVGHTLKKWLIHIRAIAP